MSSPDDLRSPRGGWTKLSLAKLGVAWPPPKGWKRQLENDRRILALHEQLDAECLAAIERD